MNEQEQAALSRLKQSKKYGELCEATIDRVFLSELPKHKRLKDAEKQARAHLHQISGAFLTPDQLRQAETQLEIYENGDAAALTAALKQHASTRERLPYAEELYGRLFDRIGQPRKILDLACGLNPLYLGEKGYRVVGLDIHGATNALINRWASILDWPVRAETRDLLAAPILEQADLALLMKLLPVLEQQEKGSAAKLLGNVPAKHLFVSFPTRTLSGRGVGMARNYARRFEDELPDEFTMLDQFEAGSELCYVLERNNG